MAHGRSSAGGASASELGVDVWAVAMTVARGRGVAASDSLCALEAALTSVQAQAVQVPSPSVWLLTASAPAAQCAGTVGLARVGRAEAQLPLRCVGAAAAVALE
eukprot:7379094-Prymnesium_polylepis.1